MTFDLYVLDLDGTPDAAAVRALVDQQDAEPGDLLTGTLQAFVDELEARFPGLDVDPDHSPWASWPLGQPVAGGRGNAFNLSWSSADTTTEAMIEAASRHGLLIFDPQADLLVPPSAARIADVGQHRSAKKPWWRRW